MEATSIKNPLQNDIQESIPKFNPLWPGNQTPDTSKTLPRRPHDAPRGPKTLQDVPNTAPGRLQDDPKTPPRRFKILSRLPQDGSKPPKTPQNAFKTPQDAPRRLQDASGPRSRAIFDRCLIDFELMFDQFFIDFVHCISVTLLLDYMCSWRGGRDAALLRVGLNDI